MEKLKYSVYRFKSNMLPDADWNKEVWKNIPAITLSNTMGKIPDFLPRTEAKLMYNDEFVFGIFKVEDRYVRSVNTEINSPVSNDSCVEFFFTPGEDVSVGYFNLEINCGGTPLIRFQKQQNVGQKKMDIKDIKKIEIAHSMPRIVEPEIKEPTTWTIEFKIPLNIIDQYYKIKKPDAGVKWRANFYKCGEETSNPHYLTWNKVENPFPKFHLPQFFGELEFL